METVTNKLKSFFVGERRASNQTAIDDDDGSRGQTLIDDVLSIHHSRGDVSYEETSQAYRDTEFFSRYQDSDHTNTVFQHLNQCKLRGGSEACRRILMDPTSDVDRLEARVDMLQAFEARLDDEDVAMLTSMSRQENDVLWFLDEVGEGREAFDLVFFQSRCLDGLNRHGTCLTMKNLMKILVVPILAILAPVAYILIPYIVICLLTRSCYPILPFVQMMLDAYIDMYFSSASLECLGGGAKLIQVIAVVCGVFLYFNGLFDSIGVSSTVQHISKHIVDRMSNVAAFVKSSNILLDKFGPTLEEDEDPRELCTSVAGGLPSTTPTFFGNFGKLLACYKTVDRAATRRILRHVYYLDAVVGLISAKRKLDLSYVTYSRKTLPELTIEGCWHPGVDKEKVVKNDITPHNVVITGPNSAGKSMLIKSIVINVILGQTCGLSFSHACRMTPFKHILSQMNVPDCNGRESLFEAEMYRCKSTLDALKDGERCLVVMDEMFNSTNPIEGIAGAYAVAKQMATHKNAMVILTTHYMYLTKLAKDTGVFRNYKMDMESILHRPFKLERGVSRQFVALELLKHNGFDRSIVDEAIEIKSKLLPKKAGPE